MRVPRPSELVAAAKTATGATNDKRLDLALFSRYGISPGQPLINRWANDRASPNYENTVLLLHAAGWLNDLAAAERAAAEAAAAAARTNQPAAEQQPQAGPQRRAKKQ